MNAVVHTWQDVVFVFCSMAPIETLIKFSLKKDYSYWLQFAVRHDKLLTKPSRYSVHKMIGRVPI